MTLTIEFSGEESARFTRFALKCLALEPMVPVRVVGREPLTSRSVRFDGAALDAVLDGYMRYVVVRESGSAVEYWVAGSNATRSIAATSVQFDLSDRLAEGLIALVRDGDYVPGLMHNAGAAGTDWAVLESCMSDRSEASLQALLDLLPRAADAELAREVALAIRAFASVATRRRPLRTRTERALLEELEGSADTDTRIAIVEDLGYVGSNTSVQHLGRLLLAEAEADHVRWAAAVALGRLNLRDAEPFLRAGVASQHTWTKAAALLGLARRSEQSDRSELEPLFAAVIAGGEEPLLQRYACLGLGKFGTLDESSLHLLSGLLGRTDVPISVRGYAALALSSAISQANDDQRREIELVFSQHAIDVANEPAEPETVWGLEFLAELATLLELHEVANDYYAELGLLFDDWRGPYYDALSLYEQGESAIVQGDTDELPFYQQSLRILESIEKPEEDAQQAIAFRLDVIKGRLDLQQALRDWESTFEPDQLHQLAVHLRGIAGVFARYGNAAPVRDGMKRLSDREREYLNGTRRLIDVMSTVVQLEATLRLGAVNLEHCRAGVQNLSDVLMVLSHQFRDQLTRGPLALAEQAHRKVDDALIVLMDTALSDGQREASVRALVQDLRSLFRRSTWPMPARACPIGGLGRGSLSLIVEDTPGTGSLEAPLTYPADSPPVLNILVEISEMAPGGATQSKVYCNVAGRELVQPVHAVEGPVQCTFLLPDVLSTVANTLLRFQLIFEARDCSQVAMSLDVFARRDSPGSRVGAPAVAPTFDE